MQYLKLHNKHGAIKCILRQHVQTLYCFFGNRRWMSNLEIKKVEGKRELKTSLADHL